MWWISLACAVANAKSFESTFSWSPHPLGSSGGFSRAERVEGLTGDLAAACTCDQPFLTCRPISFADGVKVAVYWSVSTRADWPVTPGPAGTCAHDGQRIEVAATFALQSLDAWMRGDEVVVPVTSGSWYIHTLDTAVPDAATLYGEEEDTVRCTRTDDGALQVWVRDAPAEPRVERCATWEGRDVQVRLLPYTLPAPARAHR